MSIFLTGFTFIEGPLQLYALHGPMFLFVDRLGFSLSLSVYSQIDSGCGIKIVAVFVSAKNTLSGHQPTNPDPGSVSTTSVQNKQPPAPNASNQNNQSTHTQTGVKKFSSPKRTPTRHSAAKDFSVWRRACFIMARNRIQKTSRNMAPERDLDCRCSPHLWLQAKLTISLTSIQDKFARLFMSIAAELWLRDAIDTVEEVFTHAARNSMLRPAEKLAQYMCSLTRRAESLATPETECLLYATYWFRSILSELIGAAMESADVNRERASSGPVKVVVTNRPTLGATLV